uniref:Ankyrin repeat and MYND domain containing 1 n=1 Tax=Molossus molossus TaxID=27622 RepID=A0A7J8FPF8_MOLMO|nr:ankyrin repeat and MYND domain containing 1 [Molossus molossus]
MESGYNSDQVPRDGQVKGRGSEPAAFEDPGTLESSTLFSKRNVPGTLEEEEEESQDPLREQDLKEAYVQLVRGMQEWQDGCVYRGHFGLDMKLGYGEFSWPTGESYQGQFYRDHRHGFGTYMWPDGSRFTGMFYLSCRDGYGTMYMKARLFQVHCHIDIINLLLDHGADVNRCTDEGLTALGACFLLYYPAGTFKPNIAERTAPEPQEAPKFSATQNSFTFHDSDSTYSEEMVLTSGSPESIDRRGSSQKCGSTSLRGSTSDSDKGPDDALESLDQGTLGSHESVFGSNMCVQNFSIELSWDLLEKGAEVYSRLRATSGDTGSNRGTMRQMALSMIERRNRWLTIHRLLHRGADPNLCRVPMQVLFFAVKAGDVDGVKLLLENGARTDVQLPPEG